MLHPYNNSNWQSDPFLGQGTRVFVGGDTPDSQNAADADDEENQDGNQGGQQTQVAGQPENAPKLDLTPEQAKSQANETLNEFKDYVPGSILYPHDQILRTKQMWHIAYQELNAAQAYLDKFEKIRDRLDEPDFNLNDLRWINSINGLFAKMGELDQQVQDGRFGALELSEESRRLIRARQTEDIKSVINALLDDFRKERKRQLDILKEQMRADFAFRLEFLADKWKEEPPAGYSPEHAAKQIEYIEIIREDLDSHFTSSLPLDEYRKMHHSVVLAENRYNQSISAAESNVTIEQLENEFQELVGLKSELVDPVSSEAAQEVDVTLSELDELVGAMQRGLSEGRVKQEFYDNEMKSLNLLKKNLEGSRDLSSAFNNILFDDTYWLDEDGKKTDMRKGLRHQLDYLKTATLSPEDLLGKTEHFQSQLQRLRTMMEDAAKFKENDLKVARERIRDYLDMYNEAQGTGESYTWHVISVQNIIRTGEIIKESVVRRYKRAEDGKVGAAMKEIFRPMENVPYLNYIPSEFDTIAENAEQEEVSAYQKAYDNKDAWEIADIAGRARNQDELKACFQLLSDRGRLRWDDPRILAQLNKFQDRIEFNTSNVLSEMRDMSRFHEKLHLACGYIWDFDTYTGFENSNNSNYEGGKQKYAERCNKLAEVKGGLSQRMQDMLSQYKAKGLDAKIDPHEYEQILWYSLEAGKMTPEGKLYYIIQGIACGLLAPDRGSAFASKFINQYPAIDVFGSETSRGEKPDLRDVQEWATMNYGDNEPGVIFNEWFHNHVMQLPRVTQRGDKALTGGNKLDHDDSTPFMAYLSDSTMKTLLSLSAQGSYNLPMTGIQNASVAMLHYMDTRAEAKPTNDPKVLQQRKKDLRRFIATFMLYDGITSDRMYRGNQSYFRWGASGAEDQSPRSDGLYKANYGRNGLSTKDYLRKVRGYISKLDPQFFEPIFKNEVRSNEEVQAHIAKIQARYPGQKIFGDRTGQIQTIDQLHEYMGEFINFILRVNPNAVDRMYADIREEHDSAFVEMKADALRKGKTSFKTAREQHAEYDATKQKVLAKIQETAGTYVYPENEAANKNSWFNSQGQIAA